MKRTALASACLAVVALAGCTATPSGPASASPAATTTDFLTAHGLAGLTATQIVEKLDASEADRTAGPAGSVRPDKLILTDKQNNTSATLPLPADRFYLAMAPYEKSTHECFNHATATCKGEIVGTPVHVTLVDDHGATVADRDMTTQANGFASMWVPRRMKGTLTVSYNGKSVTTPVSTYDNDPTCLTTPLKLT